MNKFLNNFFDWLNDEAKGKAAIGYVIFAAVVSVSLEYAVRAALENWGLLESQFREPGEKPFQYYNTFMFITLFIWAPLKEEVIFRVLPLFVVISFFTKSPWRVFIVATGFAVLFGAIHPYGLVGKAEAAISGFFFSLIFLKCGGLNKSFMKASTCAIVTHGLCNVFGALNEWWDYLELNM